MSPASPCRCTKASAKDSHAELIIGLCKEAMRHIDRTDKPRLRQHVQLMLGDRYLHQGASKEAWKVFLAAGFNGDPRLDGVVRHELGRAYEELGRHRRAYSSYQRALSKPMSLPADMKANAEAGLARLRPYLDEDDPLLAEDYDG